MAPLVNSEFYSFTTTIKANFAASIADYVVGIAGNITLLMLWWKHRKTDNDHYSIVVISTDLLSVGNVAVGGVIQCLTGFNDHHLGPGENYCIAFGLLAFCNCFTSLFAVTLYSYQRYLIVFKKATMPLRQCYLILAMGYLFLGLLATCCLFFEIPFIYYPAGTYCMFDFGSRTLVVIVANVINLLIMAVCLWALALMYFKILRYTHFTFKTFIINNNSTTETPNDEEKEFTTLERSLILRSIIIVSVSFFCYTPYALGTMYNMIFQQLPPPLFDAVAGGLVVSNGVLDFLVFIITNSAYKRDFWNLFGVHFG